MKLTYNLDSDHGALGQTCMRYHLLTKETMIWKCAILLMLNFFRVSQTQDTDSKSCTQDISVEKSVSNAIGLLNVTTLSNVDF
jgi:hypothetical protein